MRLRHRLLAVAVLGAAALLTSGCVGYGYSQTSYGYYDENGVWYDASAYPGSGYYSDGAPPDPYTAGGYYYPAGTYYYPTTTTRTIYVQDRNDDRHHGEQEWNRERDQDRDGS